MSAVQTATEDGLLGEVLASPDDDAPRLVYADWLEEQGHPRGEFIRIQCELAQIDPSHDHYAELHGREQQLLRRYAKTWAGKVINRGRRFRYHRGFIHHVSLSAEKFLKYGDEIASLVPLESLRLINPGAHVDALAQFPLLGRLKALDFSQQWLDERSLRRLLQAARSLTRFRSSSTAFPDVIAASERWGQLELLDLSHSYSGANELSHIEALPQSRIGELRLGPTVHYPTATRIRFVNLIGAYLPELSSLGLPGSQVDRTQLRELDQLAPHAKPVALDLSGNALSRRDEHWPNRFRRNPGSSLADLALLTQLHTFDVSDCRLDYQDIDLFKGLPNIRQLALSRNLFNVAGIASILEACGRRLTRLDLAGAFADSRRTQLSSPLIKTLMEAGLPALSELSLGCPNIRARGVRLFDKSLLEQLSCLDLRKNELGSDGGEWFADIGPWPKLAHLDLRKNNIGPATRNRLRKAFGYRVSC